jgi:hypothetical protein
MCENQFSLALSRNLTENNFGVMDADLFRIRLFERGFHSDLEQRTNVFAEVIRQANF